MWHDSGGVPARFYKIHELYVSSVQLKSPIFLWEKERANVFFFVKILILSLII